MLIRPMMFRGPAGGGGVLRPQDVFATSLYTGNGGTQTITNGLDLAGQGGLVWLKRRDGATSHGLYDTQRGASRLLQSNATGAELNSGAGNEVAAFGGQGFTLGPGANIDVNANGGSYVAQAFRRAAKFFDIQPYLGDGTSGRQIPHNLGIAPGMVVVKRLDGVANWITRHRSIATGSGVVLDTPDSAFAAGAFSGSYDAAMFQTATGTQNNVSGARYVAYLFAHDPDPNGIIQCGSFTTDANGAASIPLPWTPQYLKAKPVSRTGDWEIYDTTRGWLAGGVTRRLFANLSSAEDPSSGIGGPNAAGFTTQSNFAPNATHVFTAIRAPI